MVMMLNKRVTSLRKEVHPALRKPLHYAITSVTMEPFTEALSCSANPALRVNAPETLIHCR